MSLRTSEAILAKLQAIADASTPLGGVLKLVRLSELQSTGDKIRFNSLAQGLINRAEIAKAVWRDEATIFLFDELANKANTNAMALRKLSSFWQARRPGFGRAIDSLCAPLRELWEREAAIRAAWEARPTCYVVTALPSEFRAVLRRVRMYLGAGSEVPIEAALGRAKSTRRQHAWLDVIVGDEHRQAKVRLVLLSAYGPMNAYKATQEHLNREADSPRHIFVVGIAGHLSGEVDSTLGDLVVSNGIYDAIVAKEEQDGTLYLNRRLKKQSIALPPSIETWTPREQLVDPPKELRRPLRLHFGPVVSGPRVVKNPTKKKQIEAAYPRAVAVEMEAVGCRWAVADHGIPVTVVKALSDWSDETKNNEWQPYCADIAADCAVDIIVAAYGREV